jgi:elongation factor G
MKALRHESPVSQTPSSALAKGDNSVAYVLKTVSTSHGGKMSVARVLAGKIGDGTSLVALTPMPDGSKRSLMGQHSEKRGPAQAGETVAFGKLIMPRRGHIDRRPAGARAACRRSMPGAGDRVAAKGARMT